MEMVSSQLSGGTPMRFTNIIGSPVDYIPHQSIKPSMTPCPQGSKKGKRKPGLIRRIPHIAALRRRAWIVADVGVYKARCACSHYCQAPIPVVPYRGRYSYAVRNPVVHALSRARMPYGLGIRRRQADDRLTLSLGYIQACCL